LPLPSKRPILVRRLHWHGLADVPQLDDPITDKSKDVYERHLLSGWRQLHARVNRDKIAVLERSLDLERLLRKFFRVRFHSFRKRLGVAAKVRVVMPELA